MILDSLPNVKALPTQQKRQLIEELWLEVLDDEQENEGRDAAIEKLLEYRHQKYLEDPASAMTLDEFRARHEENKRAWRASQK